MGRVRAVVLAGLHCHLNYASESGLRVQNRHPELKQPPTNERKRSRSPDCRHGKRQGSTQNRSELNTHLIPESRAVKERLPSAAEGNT